MNTIKIFIASSSELEEDRDQFRIFISQENDRLHKKGIYLEIVQWENFLDTISDTRLQDEYNNAIRDCDIVLCLFFTKVGKYTAEEFDTAYQVFKDKGKPKIWTYFKNAPLNTGSITEEINTLLDFKSKIGNLGHFFAEYTNIDNLLNKYRTQLDKFLQAIEQESKPGDIIDSGSPMPVKASDSYTFNELLTVKLIDAIKPYNRKANDFLMNYNNWESNADLIPTVKRIIISGFVGVVGIQIRKLMSIGEEEFSESKMKRYLENCQMTVKRTLQLVSYALISALWDQKLNNNARLSEAQVNVLFKFFKSAAEETTAGYADLLKMLINVFSENKIDIPIAGLKEFQINLEPGSSFIEACKNMHAISEVLKSGAYTVTDCVNAEANLVVILEKMNFLAQYKMISIKDIDYNQQRHDKEGIYLHNYSLLEGDSQANNNSQGKVRKESSPVISYAVLLFKDNYRQNINLVPFIIDYNALGFNGGSKICFYSYCNTYDDLNLNYSFIEDNSRVTIKRSKNIMPADDQAFNKWLANPENRKDMNFDNVFNLFTEAKRTLAGIVDEYTDDTI